MAATATTPAAGQLDVGDTWLLGVEVRDDSPPAKGAAKLVDATVAVTVTRPDDTTAGLAVTRDNLGQYSASYVLLAAGRHFAVASVSGTVVSVVTYAVTAFAPGKPPTVTDVRAYLDESGAKWSDPELQEVLDAERVNQAKLCVIDAVFPPDLRQALLRRCMRALALRSLPLAMPQGDAETGPQILPGRDPEVKRLEAPHRRVVVA